MKEEFEIQNFGEKVDEFEVIETLNHGTFYINEERKLMKGNNPSVFYLIDSLNMQTDNGLAIVVYQGETTIGKMHPPQTVLDFSYNVIEVCFYGFSHDDDCNVYIHNEKGVHILSLNPLKMEVSINFGECLQYRLLDMPKEINKMKSGTYSGPQLLRIFV